jgi:hypothetical protein
MNLPAIMAAVGVLEIALTELHALSQYADPTDRARAARRVTSARMAVEEAARAALTPQSGLKDALAEAAWKIATGGQSKKLGRTLRGYAERL